MVELAGGQDLGVGVGSYQVSRVRLGHLSTAMHTAGSVADISTIFSYRHILKAQNMSGNSKKHIRQNIQHRRMDILRTHHNQVRFRQAQAA
jgi:hypothetical protein